MVNNKRSSVLTALQKTDGWVSGESLSGRIGISRVAVWKHIKILREEGYPIQSGPRGYRIAGVKDNLSALDFYKDEKIHFYRELESTMDEAGRKILQGEENSRDYIILADHQMAGKNRTGDNWSSPEGGIYMSCVLNRALPLSEAEIIPLRGAMAALETLEACGMEGLSFCPPGDILLKGKKVGGILEDYRVRGKGILWYILGIGIHLNDNGPAAVESEQPPLFSISDLTGRKILRKEFIRRFSEIWEEILKLPPETVKEKIQKKMERTV